MNNEEIFKKLEEMGAKIEDMQKTVRKLNNYFKWTAIITVVLILLPLIGLIFAIPSYIKTLDMITAF